MKMIRTSPLAAITLSTMVTTFVLQYGAQRATSFVLPSPVSLPMSNAIESCGDRSPLLTCGSHIINKSMPLHLMVEGNSEASVIPPKQDTNGIYDLATKEDHL